MISARVFALIGICQSLAVADPVGVRRVQVLNYENCLELSNASTKVVLGHQVGGRVLQYTWQGKEALYLDPRESEWTSEQPLDERVVSAGRFDIGPEYLIKRGLELWAGEWAVEVIGDRAARLTSVEDPVSGVQLTREFRLAEEGSRLTCTQNIRNVSDSVKRWCHWSRTFAMHGGIVAIPLTPDSTKMPKHYVRVEGRGVMNAYPKDDQIRVRDGFLEILGVPAHPKLGFDSMAGWFAYAMPNDVAFVKRYSTYPERVYNEVAGYTISIWYPKASFIPAVELEPIGPANAIAPGESASFTEHWELMDYDFPVDGEDLDLKALARQVQNE